MMASVGEPWFLSCACLRELLMTCVMCVWSATTFLMLSPLGAPLTLQTASSRVSQCAERAHKSVQTALFKCQPTNAEPTPQPPSLLASYSCHLP